ncbi:MAG: hypothetical protein A2V90_06875 [Gammaproteobacteria bacterium RBG_16_57_12]|nr:MAG: hypothetical protein A2V90_06875 [Gammaproteobacteria bacterium RBG_16_57_12]
MSVAAPVLKDAVKFASYGQATEIHLPVAGDAATMQLIMRPAAVREIRRQAVPASLTAITPSTDGGLLLANENALWLGHAQGVPSPLVGDLPPGKIIDMSADGQRIHVLTDAPGLWAFTLHDKTMADIVPYRLPYPVQRMSVQGAYGYALDGQGGFVILARGETAFEEIARFSSGATFRDIDVAGDYAYLVDDEFGLTVVDVHVPRQPRWVGSNNRLAGAIRVVANEKQILVADRNQRVFLLDPAQIEQPTLSAMWSAPAQIDALALGQDGVIAASGTEMITLDFAHAQLPPVNSIGANQGGSRRVAIRDHLAYVADWFSGLHVYDISRPEQPRHVALFHTPGSAKGVTLLGDYALVGDDDHGLQIIDIRDPQNMKLVANVPTPGLAYTLQVQDQRVYLADHRGGFHIIDISNITAPVVLGSFDTPGKVWALALDQGYVFAADDKSGVLVFDVTDPGNIRQIGAYDPGGYAEDIVIRDHHAYVTFFDRGLVILDISDPRQPVAIGQLATPGNARGIRLQGELAYLADWDAGLQIIDISDKRAPRFVGHYDTAGAAWGVELVDSLAYVMDWWGGFKVLEVSVPETPRLLASYHGREQVQDILVQEGFAYTATGTAGVQIYDVNNPDGPIWLNGLDLAGDSQDLAVQRGRLFVAGGAAGLSEIDISRPHESRLVATHRLVDDVVQVRTNEDTVVVRSRTGKVYVQSGDRASHPAFQAVAAGNIIDLWLSQNRLYLLNASGRVRVLALNMTELFAYETGGPARLVRADEARMYLSDGVQGVQIIDVGADKPQPLAAIEIGDEIIDMRLSGDSLYLSTAKQGLMVLDISQPAQPRLTQIYPAMQGIGAIALAGQSVLLGGDTRPASVTLLPPVTFTAEGKHDLRVQVPARFPPGRYDMILRDGAGKQARAAALEVQLAGKGKPLMSKEQFEQLLRQQRETAGAR